MFDILGGLYFEDVSELQTFNSVLKASQVLDVLAETFNFLKVFFFQFDHLFCILTVNIEDEKWLSVSIFSLILDLTDQIHQDKSSLGSDLCIVEYLIKGQTC